MDILQTTLMGIIQGLSEFLPISSSAHLVFTSNFYKFFKGLEFVQDTNQEVFLDMMLHIGTLIAVLIYFRKDISNITKAFLLGIKTKSYDSKDFQTGLYIIVGTIITAIVAYPISSLAEKLVFTPYLVGILLIITGIILLFSEHVAKKIKEPKEIGWKNSCFIAIAQGLATLPGFSRSGLTIATGLLTGSDRLTSANYSFLLSIPIILGASICYPLIKIDFSEVIRYDWLAIITGTIVSAVVGYLCIKYFLKFLSKFSLAVFGFYCIFAGIISTAFFTIYK